MNYELILQPNKKRMIKGILIFTLMLGLGVVCYLIAQMYWDEFVTYRYTVRGRRRASGWPSWLELASGWMMAIGGLGAIMTIVTMIRKKSSFGLNKNGLMINLVGWNEVFIDFKEIASLEETNTNNEKGLIVHFHSINDIIEKYGAKQKNLLIQEHVTKKKPMSIDSTTAKGDIPAFILKLKNYFQASQNPQ